MSNETPVPGIPGAIFRRVAAVPAELVNAAPAGAHMMARHGALLIDMPRAGRFLARNGDIVEYAPLTEADDGVVQLVLHGSARGALIHQRGELPLHAATLVPPGGDRALAICGPSGAGKSTLGAALSRRGWTLVADDTTRVTWDGTSVMAWPSRDSIKLWLDACEASGIATSDLTRAAAEMDKFYVPVASRDTPVRLDMIIEIVADDDAPIAVSTLADKMGIVSRNTYRSSHIKPLGMQKDHIQIVSRVVSHCRLDRLRGGRTRPLDVLADAAEGMMRG